MKIFISIICPIYQEEKYIGKCIESILRQDYPRDRLELLLIDGLSTDKTREIVGAYQEKYPFIRLIDNPYKVVPVALNIGIKQAKGDVIMRIDGHCEYPDNYVSSLIHYLFKLNADNVGGIWNTLPARPTTECIAIAEASSHIFGVGGSIHKVGTKQITRTDTVPFGCYRRSVFDRIGFFDEELVRNQDDELNARLINNGGKIYLIPETVINYIARDSFKKMCRMYYQYGLFKPLVTKKLGVPATVRQFFPALFLGSLVIGFVLIFVSRWFLWLYVSVLALYFLIGSIIGFIKSFRHRKVLLVLYMPLAFFLIHVSYGWGYLNGIFKLVLHEKIAVEVNR